MIAYLIVKLGDLYGFIIIVYCILTWFPISRDGIVYDIRMFFEKITDPYLNLFRKLIPPIGGTVDVTPIIALLVLQLAVRILARLFS